MKTKFFGVAAAAAFLGAASPGNSESYNFSTLVFPSPIYGAEAFGVNNAGQIVGSYVDTGGGLHGYLYSNGAFTTLNAPSAALGTQAFGINASGQIVGEFFDSSNGGLGWGGGVHGFVFNNGSYTPINNPLGNGGTYATSINASGQIVGLYAAVPNTTPNGFLYSNGTFVTLPSYLSGGYPQIAGINASGQIVGSTYGGGGKTVNGFVYSNGTFAPINNPLGVNGTAVTGINDLGELVGFYLDSNNIQHGYLFSKGIFTTIDDPLGTHGTVVSSINDAGLIVGYYLDSNDVPQIGGANTDYQRGVHYAFFATPVAETPLPAALPLFATGLGVIGLLGWWGKWKVATSRRRD